jgi:hypothetical protein
MFEDISNINDNFDMYYILTSIIIVDLIIICIARNTTILNKQINVWYDKFGLSAVILDVLIILIGFIITRYIFSTFHLEFSPLLFIIISLLVQIIHDFALYEFIIKPTPSGSNQIIDVYKNYAEENGYKIIIADSTMVLASGLLAMYLKNNSVHITTTLLVVGIYSIPYLLYQTARISQ